MFDVFDRAWLEVHRDTGTNFVALRADRKRDHRSIWIFMQLEDWERLSSCPWDVSYSDGTRQLLIWGEHWLIYDTPQPSAKYGDWETGVRGVSLNMPRKALERWSSNLASAFEEWDRRVAEDTYANRVKIPADPEWWQIWGRGKGQIKIEADDRTRDFLQECRNHDPSGQFSDMLERIETIARSTTEGIEDIATVQISRDAGGFFWRAGGMHGGLINHGTQEAPDWSIHT